MRRRKGPPPELAALLDVPAPPVPFPGPGGRHVALAEVELHPPLAVCARPWLGLAGLRLDPERRTRRRLRAMTALSLLDTTSGDVVPVQAPPGARLSAPRWSPDGERIAFLCEGTGGATLWVAHVDDGRARRLAGAVNDVLCEPCWLPEGKGLVAALVPEDDAPPARSSSAEPWVEDADGREAPSWTLQDLLRDRDDERWFEHLARSRPARIGLDGEVAPLAPSDVHAGLSVSPDGVWLLVETLRPPWSHAVAWPRFARHVSVWPFRGGEGRVLLERPLADAVPIEGVPEGPRGVDWQPLRPATLVFAEALDGGDPRREVPARDRLMAWPAPFEGAPQELLRVQDRLVGLDFTDRAGEVLVTGYDRERRWLTSDLHTVAPEPRIDTGVPEPRIGAGAPEPRLGAGAPEPRSDASQPHPVRRLFDRSALDAAGDPGEPLRRVLDDGRRVIEVRDGWIHLSGRGGGPEGERPFLDRLRLDDGAKERVLESPPDRHERAIGRAGDRDWLVISQSVAEPPDLFAWREDGARRRLTASPDPHPRLTRAPRRLLRYQRGDGVPLSGMLYLPPDAPPDRPLPLVFWAYPVEFSDADTAGQVRAAPTAFTRVTGFPPLPLLARGYAVLLGASMPVVGPPATANDRFVEEIVANATAAVERLVADGVADPTRIAVAGHSYGAFMTANLLAHTRLFACGVAISGAYNRSLTPFGFQHERRSLWQAPETYLRVSPFFAADRIEAPLLLVHGAEDENAGSQTFQSRRLFEALRGLGKRARLVLLPHESHVPAARESMLALLAEVSDWLDTHLATPCRK